MSDVFLRHHRNDSDFATVLRMRIEKAGLTVWVDTDSGTQQENWDVTAIQFLCYILSGCATFALRINHENKWLKSSGNRNPVKCFSSFVRKRPCKTGTRLRIQWVESHPLRHPLIRWAFSGAVLARY